MNLINQNIQIESLIKHSNTEVVYDITTPEHIKNMKKLELVMIDTQIEILLWIDNREIVEGYNFIELNTSFIIFIDNFMKNNFAIKDFLILTEVNNFKWEDLHRKWQRRIENKYIVCNLIRPNTTNEDFEKLLQIIT
jgi:hypothetical protein